MKKLVFLLILSLFFCSQVCAEESFMSHQLIEIEFSYGTRTGYYTGPALDGKPEGYGLFESQNTSGDRWHYIGEFSNGTFNGNGANYWELESEHEIGQYEDGDFVSGEYYLVTIDGMYSGDFTDANSMTLNGKVYNQRRQIVFEGSIKNGVFEEGTLYNLSDGSIAATGKFGEGFKQFIQGNYINGYMY